MSELIDPSTRKAIDKHYSNLMWYQNNYHYLKKGHNGQFILIIDEGKTEYYTDINALRERLKKDDINKQSVAIEYITDNDGPKMV